MFDIFTIIGSSPIGAGLKVLCTVVEWYFLRGAAGSMGRERPSIVSFALGKVCGVSVVKSLRCLFHGYYFFIISHERSFYFWYRAPFSAWKLGALL